jgi:hypothetical protein
VTSEPSTDPEPIQHPQSPPPVQQAPNRNVRTIMILAIVGVLVVAVVSVGITLALTKDDGKSQTATPFQAPAPLPVATSSVPAPSVPTNARQNIEKQIRETAGFGGVTPAPTT